MPPGIPLQGIGARPILPAMRIMILATVLTASPALPDSGHWADLAARGAASGRDPCSYAASDAQGAMQRRYRGESMSDQLATGPAPLAMLQDAYNRPRMASATMQAHQLAEFRDAWESACYAEIGAPLQDMSTDALLQDMRDRIDSLTGQ